ncbi:MAG: alpha-ketoglutarate-dependent dioxygenase AlkB [Pseudomonadota bacterium]
MNLFDDDQKQWLSLIDEAGEVCILPNCFSEEESQLYFSQIYNEIAWAEETIMMFGKPVTVPRLVAWYGDPQVNYQYSGLEHTPLPWLPVLNNIRLTIMREINRYFNLPVTFNSVLCNLYRNGHDAMGWHSDNEAELGTDPFIASVSFGTTRFFDIKLKNRPRHENQQQRFALEKGALLVMKGPFQRNWLHQVPKQKKVLEPRINLTFRYVKPSNNASNPH